MNRLLQEKWPMLEGTHGMRTSLLDSLTDADLAFTPGGTAHTFGALCREMGDVQHSYTDSIKNLKQVWTYQHPDKTVETSVAALKKWFESLDADMKAAVEALTDADLSKTVDRGGFSPAVDIQLEIYLQALLIFFGKATIYLRTMNKPLPPMFPEWIG